MSYRIAVDIGGTFTDLVAIDDESGDILVDKSPSSAADPISAVLRVIEKAGVPPSEVDLFIHGTTVSTNALIERKGTRVAFITNTGFRDVIFIQNANRRDLYSLDWEKPRPLAARFDCLEIDCRVDSAGGVRQHLDPADIEKLIEHLRAENIDSVAISFLFSYVNPVHELELATRLRAAMPDLFISLSHEVYPRWRENDRGHTTIADAYLKPMFSGYLNNLEQGLEDAGSPARLLMMKSNGGVVEAEAAALQPANFLVSGPVGGVLGGAHFAQLAGIDDLMTLDIGGTSCDVSLVSQQELGRSASFEIELGMPVGAPMVDIRAIGAGGGSIAWIDPGGLLRVGPQSAASDPGPACYSQGGTDATLTDANLVLGRLNAANFCGGDIPLDEQLAKSAVKALADQLGEPLEQTAHSMIDLANHNMVDALNVISVERGIDPRDYALVAFGGAGALHAVAIAQIIGISTVLIPPYPGNTSTFGLLTANLRSDLSTTLLIRSDEQEAMSRLNAALVPLRQRTIEALRRDGYTGEPEIEQKLEMRYLGQNYHRDIVIAPEAPLDAAAFDDAIERFHDDYAAFYGYSQRDDIVEVVGLVVTATGSRSGRTVELKPRASDADAVRRPVYFRENGSMDTRVTQREGLTVGELVEGPAIIEESLSTTVVPPAAQVRVHESGSLLIETMSGAS